MYRSIVRRQYRKAWQAMNRHDYEAIIAQLAPTFKVTFVGDTSLGGSRHQLGTLCPGLAVSRPCSAGYNETPA